MCYTIEKNLTREELQKRFGAKFKPNRPFAPGKRVSAFSLPEVPVITNNNPDEITTMVWGLIPFWVKDEDGAQNIRMKTFNARVESLNEKPSFRHTTKNQRCMVLTNGYYEWQHSGKEKTPFLIKLKNDLAMPMAGLYDNWTNQETGEIIESFTIITTRANSMMEKIHNTKKRMPVILNNKFEDEWLNSKSPELLIHKLAIPFEEKNMEVSEVEKALFSTKSTNDPQGKLF